MIESLRADGNPHGQPAAERMRWADGLRLKDVARDKVEVLLHIGCDNACAPEQWPELKAIVTLLTQAGVDFGIAASERATGELAYDLGFQDDARAQAQAMRALIHASGAKTVVTCSAGSYAAFRNIWPRMALPLKGPKVRHVSEFVEGLFQAGRQQASGALDATVTYHDSCKLGRLSEAYTLTDSKWTTVLNNWAVHEPAKPILFGNHGLYDAPRTLLARITGGNALAEMPRNRGSAWCCGGAGGARQAFPEFSKFAAVERIEEARSTGASLVVTASCACQRQLDAAARAAEPAGPAIEVSGLFALLARMTAPARHRRVGRLNGN